MFININTFWGRTILRFYFRKVVKKWLKKFFFTSLQKLKIIKIKLQTVTTNDIVTWEMKWILIDSVWYNFRQKQKVTKVKKKSIIME